MASEGKESAEDAPKVVYRKDYRTPPFEVPATHLLVRLDPAATTVTATLTVVRSEEGADLCLDGSEVFDSTTGVSLNGVELAEGDGYEVRPEAKGDASLVIASSALPAGVGEQFTVRTTVTFSPKANTELQGLYTSGPLYCTQCEATGFRRIAWAMDRPDVMSRYTVRVEADKAKNPVLLSNGNKIGSGELDDGAHFAEFEDPWPKPSYLFALVAGDLGCLEDSFTTMGGREVKLFAWADHDRVSRLRHAMESLKRAMKWDEDTFGREYDLDMFHFVAVNAFNQGAMENKGLNIFNTVALLADPETTSDERMEYVLGVVGHEFFHNWSGNRVTVRDWFQLTLKEGFTKFRDGIFSQDMTSAAHKRIMDVKRIREHQFPEDAGPMSHPIRPDSYISFENYYTVTVYWKGAEVHRMYRTILGHEMFRKGTDLYFTKYDGKAVSCDELRESMAEVSGRSFDQFDRWYSQSGTPVVDAHSEFDAAAGTYTLTLAQSCPPTTGQTDKLPFEIPVLVGLVDSESGSDLSLKLSDDADDSARVTTRLLLLTEPEQSFTFVDVGDKRPVLSLLRDWSAPVKATHHEETLEDLEVLMGADSDAFVRWDSAQKVAMQVIKAVVDGLVAGKTEAELPVSDRFIDAVRSTLADDRVDGSLKALSLTLPEVGLIGETMEVMDLVVAHRARSHVEKSIAAKLSAELRAAYDAAAVEGPHKLDGPQVGARRLRGVCLDYLTALGADVAEELLNKHLEGSTCMTDTVTALRCLSHLDCTSRPAAFDAFEAKWKEDTLVMDTWFSLQANSSLPGTLDRVRELLDHPVFDLANPNKARALLGVFARNPSQFHNADGSGYLFLGEMIRKLDGINAMMASRLAGIFSNFKRFDEGRQTIIRKELEAIRDLEGLSKGTFEIVTKCLS